MDTQGPRPDRIVITKTEEGCYTAEYRQENFRGSSSSGETARGALLSLLGLVDIESADQDFMPKFASDEKILDIAREVTSGPRREKYGAPSVNHARTARLWSTVLGIDITSEQVCLLNILQKVSRLQQGYQADTVADIAGYAANLQEVHDEGRAPRVASVAHVMVMASIDRIQRKAAAENRAPMAVLPREPEESEPLEDGEAELTTALDQVDQDEIEFIRPWLEDRQKVMEYADVYTLAGKLGLLIVKDQKGGATTAYAYPQNSVGADGKPHDGAQPAFQSTTYKDFSKAVSRVGRSIIEALREEMQKAKAATPPASQETP